MGIITSHPAQKRRHRVNLFIDGKFAVGLDTEVVAARRLKTGQTVSDAELEELLKAEQLHKGMEAAVRFLSYRPRSQAEVRTRLLRNHPDWVVESVLQKLKDQRLIDDAAFAQFWKENRDAFRPRSRRLLSQELRRKGVDSETVAEVIQSLDEESSAYLAARGKAASLHGLCYRDFRRKLGSYLNRRGFDYSVSASVVNRLWREAASDGQENGLESDS
ncbi:MAG: RecX family transcriptional regulator [Chloroflexi bacterium]|nr:RecX family transcriptional regulator [Chloroflexota bacterium]